MLLNRDRAVQLMERHGFDALIATHPNHVTYASNYGGHGPRIYSDRMVFVVLPLDLKAALLAPIGDGPYLAQNRGSIWVPEVWTYGTSKITWSDDLDPDVDELRLIEILRDRDHNAKSLPELLALVLGEKKLERAIIGLDESGLDPQTYKKIVEACPKVVFRPAVEVWREIELIKTEEELTRLRRAAVANEEAVRTVIKGIRLGVSESELMKAYAVEAARRGGSIEFWNSAGGRRGGGFFPPGDYKLRKGDVFRFDAGMVLDHYHADTGGICVLGEPSWRQRELYEAITAGMDAALAAIRPGSTYEDVWWAGVMAVKERGIANYDILRSDLGHGIGIEPRIPNIARGNKMPLEPGMVINAEVPYYEIGYAGFQIEYTLLVTVSGYEPFIQSYRKLEVVDV